MAINPRISTYPGTPPDSYSTGQNLLNAPQPSLDSLATRVTSATGPNFHRTPEPHPSGYFQSQQDYSTLSNVTPSLPAPPIYPTAFPGYAPPTLSVQQILDLDPVTYSSASQPPAHSYPQGPATEPSFSTAHLYPAQPAYPTVFPGYDPATLSLQPFLNLAPAAYSSASQPPAPSYLQGPATEPSSSSTAHLHPAQFSYPAVLPGHGPAPLPLTHPSFNNMGPAAPQQSAPSYEGPAPAAGDNELPYGMLVEALNPNTNMMEEGKIVGLDRNRFKNYVEVSGYYLVEFNDSLRGFPAVSIHQDELRF